MYKKRRSINERRFLYLFGEFLVLKAGQNAISWNDAVTKVVIKPNARYL